MDLIAFPPSPIVAIARLAASLPDVELLCFGESDRASPESARNALAAALQAGATTYADVRGIPPLRAALAAYLSALHARPVAESRIQVTASGMAALNAALAATVRAGERVLVHTPVWPHIPNVARLRGAELDEVALQPLPEGGFRLDLDRLAVRLPGARAFVLNSPNNPTGWTATLPELAAVLDLCRRHRVWLISDEVYSRLVYDGSDAAPSLLDLVEPDDRVMVVNSFSKAWAMTGWRLGWLVVPEGVRDQIAEVVEVTHSTVAPFVQHAGIAGLGDVAFLEDFRTYCAGARDSVAAALNGLEFVHYTPPMGAFYAFIRVEGVRDSLALARRLVLEHGIAVAPGSAFGGAGEGAPCSAYARDWGRNLRWHDGVSGCAPRNSPLAGGARGGETPARHERTCRALNEAFHARTHPGCCARPLLGRRGGEQYASCHAAGRWRPRPRGKTARSCGRGADRNRA
jgi:aspartate aminotransferase